MVEKPQINKNQPSHSFHSILSHLLLLLPHTHSLTMSLLPDDSSLFLLPPNFPFSLPYNDYHFTVTTEPELPAGDQSPPSATVELRIRQRYILYLEPIRGYRVTMDKDFTVSPEYTVSFKIPLSFVFPSQYYSPFLQDCVSKQLASFPIGDGLREFMNPHIQNTVVYLAQQNGFMKPFKVVFSVSALKIDLVDTEECERIRSRGLWLFLIISYKLWEGFEDERLEIVY